MQLLLAFLLFPRIQKKESPRPKGNKRLNVEDKKISMHACLKSPQVRLADLLITHYLSTCSIIIIHYHNDQEQCWLFVVLKRHHKASTALGNL